MESTFRRLRLDSHSRRTDAAFKRNPTSRLSSHTIPHLVKTYGRFCTPSSALATTSSEWPRPYTAAVSTQFAPRSSASRIAAIESASSCPPQANSHPPPPIAHAPNPIGVIYKSEFPSFLVFILVTPLKKGGRSRA